ncbi:excinuclease ABC subunit A [Alteromonas gracilis]|uniref:excinuclease ABC subunit A n=1 Tax=Alteromonas gracilis TaxID=1479524 RepID=UPI0037352C85
MHSDEGRITVRGARVHNLKNINVDIPRNEVVVFTGVSGSGKSSLAFGTLYAEAQHRYLDSISPYARRLIEQVEMPDVDAIEGLPPAVGLHQRRGAPSMRSTVGSITTLSNSLRMLYSRAGDYGAGQSIIYADGFSPNTPEGACEQCDGIGKIFDTQERLLVPDNKLSIREGAVAAWPGAWQGKNLVRVLLSLDIDVDIPWRDLPKKTKDWILYTDETPQVPVYRNYNLEQTRKALKENEPASYKGKFISAKRHVLDTFKSTQKEKVKQRIARFLSVTLCPQCGGKKLKRKALNVTIDGLDIIDFSRLPLHEVEKKLRQLQASVAEHSTERAQVIKSISNDVLDRIKPILALGLHYLSLDRSTTTISVGELQRLRLATQLKSNLFGVVFVMDEPSSGLHPRDVESLVQALHEITEAGNSLLVVEHNPFVINGASWVVDVGPKAGRNGGQLMFNGPVNELVNAENSPTAEFVFQNKSLISREKRLSSRTLSLKNMTRNNVKSVDLAIPLGVMTVVTGVSGSGKSSLISQALVDLVKEELGGGKGHSKENVSETSLLDAETDSGSQTGYIDEGLEQISRIVVVDQSPIGRTPRSTLATYTGLFDQIRTIFASTDKAKAQGYDAGHFSFNVTKGRCSNCEGLGVVSVELLFMPSVYSPCSVCNGKRYNDDVLAVHYEQHSIADVLSLTVEDAQQVFKDHKVIMRGLETLIKVGLGYLTLGQSATEVSGGEAQRIKLASELKRAQNGNTLYVLDEPTTGLHLADTSLLMKHLSALVDSGNTVLMVEHNMQVAALCDHIIDLGPGAGEDGGQIVAQGTPEEVAKHKKSATAPFLKQALQRA